MSAYVQVLESVSHPDVRQLWQTDEKLKCQLERFLDLLPKISWDIPMQVFESFVEAHPKDPNSWIDYLSNNRFCDGLIDSARLFAERGKRIEFIPDRHPEIRLNADKMKNEPQGVMMQKKAQLDESKSHVDAVFADIIANKSVDETTGKCSNPKCGAIGYLKQREQQVRSADEPMHIGVKCRICGARVIFS